MAPAGSYVWVMEAAKLCELAPGKAVGAVAAVDLAVGGR